MKASKSQKRGGGEENPDDRADAQREAVVPLFREPAVMKQSRISHQLMTRSANTGTGKHSVGSTALVQSFHRVSAS